MNSQAIQHNLDWVWPYWVRRQFDPADVSFVPRAFNLTHINLTHRNWTAVGTPGSDHLPIVDPRGLLTPHYDGWSIDAWIISEDGHSLIPSRQKAAAQYLRMKGSFSVVTEMNDRTHALESEADVVVEDGQTVCRLRVKGSSTVPGAWLVVSVRPYNPEGVSFIHRIEPLDYGWKINGKHPVFFDVAPDRRAVSRYVDGDVFAGLPGTASDDKSILCDVGMASAAVLYRIDGSREVTVRIPLPEKKDSAKTAAAADWERSLGVARLTLPDEKFQFLYDAALRTLVLHSPDDVYPGPYTYKRFWFRDAAFILHAMIEAGMAERAEPVLDRFPSRQTSFGYFLSQEGEWDSNGEALWIMHRFCELTGKKPKPQWKHSILKAARWIIRKRLPSKPDSPHAGLLPAGFSAEHLGPNDYYYWDDFWAIAGLRSAAAMAREYGETTEAVHFQAAADDLSACVDKSIRGANRQTKGPCIPASPYRRMDAGAIGSVVVGYPLLLCGPTDERLVNTAEFLMRDFFVSGGFFQEISHSGINPYLTLHVGQVLLRAGDPRFYDVLRAVADLASPTGQWPEAVHPRTLGGCMGDGQHVWAAAEWVLMIRNCFVREEGPVLILASGIVEAWQGASSLGPVPTNFGEITVQIRKTGKTVQVSWTGAWRAAEPKIEVRLPGFKPVSPEKGVTSVRLENA
jgi:hypothetical protein